MPTFSLQDPDAAFLASLPPAERLACLKFRAESDILLAKARLLAMEHPEAWEAVKAIWQRQILESAGLTWPWAGE